jgi:hypothetical protein
MGDSFKIADYDALSMEFRNQWSKENVKGLGDRETDNSSHTQPGHSNYLLLGLSSFLSQYYNRKLAGL